MSKKDIERALDALISSIGFRCDLDEVQLLALAAKDDLHACAQAIAIAMGLPVRVDLSHVPGSTALANTDSQGQGKEGISAQVIIPRDLPMFGSSRLNGYRITLGVGNISGASPETLVTLLSHELSHVLLASVKSPYKDCEVHTDLVPLIQGFGGIVNTGRKSTQQQVTNNGPYKITKTRVTTYGYLNDWQFDHALAYIAHRLKPLKQKRAYLLRRTDRVCKKVRDSYRRLGKFMDHLAYLNAHRPKKMKRHHADRVVAIHYENPIQTWQQGIDSHAKIAEAVWSFVEAFKHFTDVSVRRADEYTSQLTDTSHALDSINDAIACDIKTLGKYVGWHFKLKRMLRIKQPVGDSTRNHDKAITP